MKMKADCLHRLQHSDLIEKNKSGIKIHLRQSGIPFTPVYHMFGDHYYSAYTCVLKVFHTQNKHKNSTKITFKDRQTHLVKFSVSRPLQVSGRFSSLIFVFLWGCKHKQKENSCAWVYICMFMHVYFYIHSRMSHDDLSVRVCVLPVRK